MAPKIKWTDESHLDGAIVRQIASGEVSRETHPEIHAHLHEVCGTCEDFLSRQGLKDTDDYDLNTHEVDRILRAILDQLDLPQQQPAKPSFWETWVLSWRAATWMAPLAALGALMLFVLPGAQPIEPTPSRPHAAPRAPALPSQMPCRWSGQKNQKCNPVGQSAFLELQVERPQSGKAPKAMAFQYNNPYRVGDALVIHFRVTQRGYLYLIRQDASGRLERLFPFSKKDHKLYPAGVLARLEANGQRVAYFLESKHVGTQVLWLVHSTRPQQFPAHRSQLSEGQKRLFSRADHLKFKVRAHPGRISKGK